MNNIFSLGLPKYNITQIENWPVCQNQNLLNLLGNNDNEEEDINVVNVDEKNFKNKKFQNEATCVLVQIHQLKLLFRQCHYCGHKIASESFLFNYQLVQQW